MRCLTLARRLAASGWDCAFATWPETLGLVPGLSESGLEVFEVSARADASEMIEGLPQGVDLLVVDDYALDARFESACRGWADRIMAIDDLADRPHDCDLLLDVTPGQTARRYKGLAPDGCRLLLGPAYALLRGEFARLRPEALERRKQALRIENVLVSFGLTDPAGATVTAVEGLLMSGLEVRADVILGRKAPGFERVRELAEGDERIRLIEYAHDMPALMAGADLALGAAGTTSWERCCLGLPTILMVLADNQEANAQGLARLGAALNLGRSEAVRIGDVLAALRMMDDNPQALRDISRAAADACDGTGADRVLSAVEELF